MFDFINILAPTCMVFILLFGIFSSAVAKKNEHKVEIPEEYTGKENVYLQLRQHQWAMIVVYTEILIALIWLIANFFDGFGYISQQCASDCVEQVKSDFITLFLKLLVILSSMFTALKYDKKKEKEFAVI